MAKPIIMTVDDELQVLNAVERDLRRQYRRDYRIVKANSGTEGLEAVRSFKERNDPIALFVADQRMPQMSGTEFLAEAMKFYPEARKVLLTAYADTEAAVTSINKIGLDFYLMKPWDPPEQNMYPVLDDLLADWQATVPRPYDGIRVAGTLWSATSHDVKDFLARNRIPYQWLDIEIDEEARHLVESSTPEHRQLPVVYFPDGEVMINPDVRTLAEKSGLRTIASEAFYDLIIIGAGPAGLGAAVYGASEGLRTLMIDKSATGGQAGTSSRIENYLGFPKGLSGAELATRATAQAQRLGAEVLLAQEVVKVRVEDPNRYVILGDGTELGCRALIIASGVNTRKLDVPGADRITGAGIYYGAALTEAAYYKDRPMYVIGGANSAGQGAMFFSRYASKVTMLVRGNSLAKSMSTYLIDQIAATPSIEVQVNTVVTEVYGEDRLTGFTTYNSETNERAMVEAPAMFVFIGAVPHTDMVRDVVACNRAGFVLTGQDLLQDGKRPKGWTLQRDPLPMETSVPGIFAAGDVRQGAVRRVASAVGQGANAVSLVHQYLRTV
jgi:thioredoxin reductase (NADPH)